MIKRVTRIFAISGLQRILGLLERRLRLRAWLIFGLMTVQSLMELVFILTLTGMAMAVGDPEGLRNSIFYVLLFRWFPALDVWTQQSQNLLLLSGVIVVAVSAIKNFVGYTCAKCIAMLGQDISLSVGEEIMQRFLHMDYAWHLSKAGQDTFQTMSWRGVLGAMLTHLLGIYAYGLTITILFLSLVGQEPALTSIVLGVTGVVGIVLYSSLRRQVDVNAQKVAESAREESRVLLQSTRGIREILIHRQQKHFLQRIREWANAGRGPRTFASIASTLPTWILESVGFIVVVLAVVFMVHVQHADSARIAAALAMLVLTAWRVLPFLNRIVSLHIEVRSLRPQAEAVLNLLERLRAEPTGTLPAPDTGFVFPDEIALEDVCFRYPGADHDALRHVNLSLRKGQKVGLVGHSGAGKSTLAAVLSGLLPSTHGRILLDGQPMTPAQAVALAMNIGYVPQNPYLFEGTLSENITFAAAGKQIDEARLRGASYLAAIDFVDADARGFELPVGEGGSGLSGGQAQRVSIARALYTEPKLLIFDEATSALDQANENHIRQTLDILPGEVTCIIIAHRLSTVENCDVLIWLDKGKVVMQGNAKDVLEEYKKKGQYTAA